MSRYKEPTSDSGDEFVNIWTTEEALAPDVGSRKDNRGFYDQWVTKSSGTLAIPVVAGSDALRALYPGYSLILTQGYSMNLLGFPGATFTPIEKTPLISNLVYVPIARSLGTVPGILANQIEFGGFEVTWKQYEYIIYSLQFPQGFGTVRQYFVLHKGPEDVSRLFLLAAGAWSDSLHDEIWVFNQGYWAKDHGLWSEIQKADWKDVILKEEFKKALQKDVYGFFASEAIYKQLAIPWKRGLIMHGPPGNGKTISLKTIMKTCGEKGFAPLYVKSFRSWKGDEGAMADVFDKARQLSPCVVILEDLDSLINDGNRSFFLNQLDGLNGNDGLLVIGTTNHFDRLDPGISTRPSRFDRKYLFDDPDEEERKLYAQYWQTKLQPNKDVAFPDQLVDKVAHLTDRFSFAYLKEVFVSSLVTLLGIEGEKPSFESLLVKQIQELRKQLDKPKFITTKFGERPSLSGNSLGRRGVPLPNPPTQRPNASSASHEILQRAISKVESYRNYLATKNEQLANTFATDSLRNSDSNIFDTPPEAIGADFAGLRLDEAARPALMPEETAIRARVNINRPLYDPAISYYTPSPDAETSVAGSGNPWNPFSRTYRQSQGPTYEHHNSANPRNFDVNDYGLL